MYTLAINYGIKDGKKFRNYRIDGKEFMNAYEVSRILTHTNAEEGNGVFRISNNATFKKGDISKAFIFKDYLLDEDIGSDKWINELMDRIETVREWADSLDFENTIIIRV